jgi:nitrite reductase/ring-hydroxylating ferredoxin subunit
VTEVRVSQGALLSEGQTLVFEVLHAGRTREAFLLRRDGILHAFLNECPHWAVELDLGDGHFFDEELDRIYCKNHGALFVVDSGQCETGPCLGRGLSKFPLRVFGEDVLVSVP